jgi:hypothetical protein
VSLRRRRDWLPGGEPSPAAEEAERLAAEAAARVDEALGASWYGRPDRADLAALALCRLRRARAGERSGAAHGDEAVRQALARANPEAVIWLASRAISFMDENGFPETLERALRA